MRIAQVLIEENFYIFVRKMIVRVRPAIGICHERSYRIAGWMLEPNLSIARCRRES